MQNVKRSVAGNRPFRCNALAGALAVVLAEGLSGNAQAVPTAPLSGPVKLNLGIAKNVETLDVELNNPGAGVALWQEKRADGRHATYFRRFDRFGILAPLQTHAVTTSVASPELLKVFDNGEFAIANRQGTVVKIAVRNKNGGLARNLKDITCKTAACQVVMDDEGDIVVAEGAQPIPPSAHIFKHVAVQLHDRTGKVVKPWFVVDQPAGVNKIYEPVALAADADGDFVVGWNGDGSALVRQFQKTGQPRGNQFVDLAVREGGVALAMDADGDFIVSGGGYDFSERATSDGWSVYRKDGVLVAQSGESLIGGSRTVVDHRVLMDDDGDYLRHFLITRFNDYGVGANTGESYFNLYRGGPSRTSLGQRIVADMSFFGEFGDAKWDDAIAMDGRGNVAALWLQSRGDGDPLGLFLQRYTGPLGEGCGGAGATLAGTDTANTINGTAGDDVIHARGGNDIVHGNGGNDVICGGTGLDKLFGDAGSDKLFGGGDNDVIDGGPDVDFADGGTGTDSCTAESKTSCP